MPSLQTSWTVSPSPSTLLAPTTATATVLQPTSLAAAMIRLAPLMAMVTEALRRNGGKVSGAAADLGVSRPTLYELMEKLGLQKPE